MCTLIKELQTVEQFMKESAEIKMNFLLQLVSSLQASHSMTSNSS